MANAKQCDICGEFYNVPEPDKDELYWDETINTSMVRVMRHKPGCRAMTHDTFLFDSCESCLQDVLDYILSKKAESAKETNND